MNSFHKWDFVTGVMLLFSPVTGVAADLLTEDESQGVVDAAYWDGPNILEVMIQDDEHATPPTPVTGSYLAGFVISQQVQANWVKSEIGMELYLDGERLDPRRYRVEWKIAGKSSTGARTRLLEGGGADFAQRMQIEAPLNSPNGRQIGAIAIEARIIDREQPDKAPLVLVQTLRELLTNSRDGL